MYGVLYCTVQLCRAAISMVVFYLSVSVKMTANTISEYLAQFLLVLPNLVLIENLLICIFYFFWNFESLKGRKNQSVWAPVLQDRSFLFIFVYLWMKTNLTEKTRPTNIDYRSLMVSLSLLKQVFLSFLFGCFWFFRYWILAAFL